MRHRPVRLPGPQGRRHHRDLRGSRDPPELTRDVSGGATYVCALAIDLHLPQVRSLKEKRAALRPIVEGLRHRHRLSVAETDHHDTWQRATIGLAAVSGSARGVTEQLDDAERFVWSHPEIEVLSATRHWLEVDLP